MIRNPPPPSFIKPSKKKKIRNIYNYITTKQYQPQPIITETFFLLLIITLRKPISLHVEAIESMRVIKMVARSVGPYKIPLMHCPIRHITYILYIIYKIFTVSYESIYPSIYLLDLCSKPNALHDTGLDTGRFTGVWLQLFTHFSNLKQPDNECLNINCSF